MSFRARVEKEIEKSDDRRGNTRDLKAQAVQSNLPESVTLKLPLFSGEATSVLVAVEIDVNPDDLTLALVSPEAENMMGSSADYLIDQQLTQIIGLAPGIAILEV